ncbi:DUF4192 domain-containing protein [Corynebacterium liangguodongii]|uniref:Uncharacterized protein n=1 Tax=Corynebacterium liangguodongii TaxID=2079535 RepID=A0A2S0WEF0_9CORY|nr:DUF4192 domain-containing protein [Corynebacterium liangguodongii]AWB84157.1 hypothetical protein C3E79_06440 [Corynebacterium liangguodongii]PWC00168.1 DUF4192 domain-containing protein [Corynebacterium liangguodongii]
MTLSQQPLTGPSDIIAALPGIFGFYPQESTVIVGLLSDGFTFANGKTSAVLGPVMRADIAHTHHMLPALLHTPGGQCEAYYAVIVTRIPDSELVSRTTELLSSLRSPQGGPLIDACWHVSEIAHGTPYTLVFGPNEEQRQASGLGKDWAGGTVSSVASSPAMEQLLSNGGLPELGREEAFAFFDPFDPEPEGHPDYDPPAARALGNQLAAAYRDGEFGVWEDFAERCAIIHEAMARPVITECEADASVFACPGDGVELAAMLSRRCGRDALIVDALASPLSAATALAWVAKAYSGEIRANALSLWAIIATERKLSSWAIIALTCAQLEEPGHSLSEMLLTMLHNGMHDELVETAAAGCAMTWEAIDPATAT